MKKYFFSFLTFFILIIFSRELFSQGFNCITATSDGINIAAAGDSGKFYRSGNSGSNWFSISESSVNFRSIHSLNDDIWICGDNSTIYKTHFGNAPLIHYSIPGDQVLNSIFFINSTTGFVCGDNGAVFKSVNGGLNWTLSNSGISSVKLNSISFKDADNGVTAGNNGIVYLTINGGSTWTQETVPTTNNFLNVKYFSDGIALAGESGTLILKNGSSWEAINTKIKSSIRGITGSGINDVHVCGGGGFIRNNKNGSPEFLNFEANPMHANLTDIFYFDNNSGLAVSSLNTSIIKTSNGGSDWRLISGSTVTYTWDMKLSTEGWSGNTFCIHPADINTIFAGMQNRIYVSRNRGDNWTFLDSISNEVFLRSFYISPLDTNVWIAATGGSVIKSTNYGNTWTVSIKATFSSYGQPLEMDQNNPGVFYIAPDAGGFYKSTDNGSTFNLISTYPFESPCDIIVQWNNSAVILVGDGPTSGSDAKIYKSSNGGVNWNLVLDSASTFDEIPSMSNTVFDNNIFYATEYGPKIYKSTNSGNNFSITYTSQNFNWASAICLEDPTSIIAGSYFGPSYLTNNSGANWISFASGSNDFESGLISPDKSYSLAYRGNGIYKLNAHYSGITSVHENIISLNIPEEYVLSQNYPNPFNPVTKIRFALPNSGDISLKVYDGLGREVVTLYNGFKSAGTYEIAFEAGELSSGIYYYQLTADGITETKKMTLIR